jgi:RNA polymerase sigma factor (sigma-70 family)
MTPEDPPAAQDATSIEATVWMHLRDTGGSGGGEDRRQAIEELRSRVARIAARLVGRDLEVEDIVQETLASTLRYARGRPGPPQHLNGFLRFRILHVLRQALAGVHPGLQLDEERVLELARVITRPTEALEEEELLVALAECVSELTGPRADAWRCTYDRGLSPRAAAEALGIAVNALHVRLCHARAAVLECLKRKGVLEP